MEETGGEIAAPVLSNQSESDQVSADSEQSIEDSIIEWKNICFLPFKMLWRIMMVIVVVMEILLVSYTLMFATEQMDYFSAAYYLFEMAYLIDTSLLMAHKCMVKHQKTRTYPPKHYFSLIVDILTLLPYYETYYLLGRASKGKEHKLKTDVLKWKVLLRIYRIPSFFFSILGTPGLNHIAAYALAHIAYFVLYSVLGGCLWYYMVIENPASNWAVTYLQYHNFNNESSISWFIISCNIIGNVFAHNWSGLIFAVRNGEYAFFIITMLFGFLNHYMILFGKLTALFIKKISDQFHFSAKLALMQQMMDDWNVPAKKQKEVMEIYNNIWVQRSGIMEAPKMIELLPKAFRKEIGLDTFWTAFKHSSVFDGLPMAAKRHLSLEMKSLFLTPGEFLLRIGEMKHRMIYVVSGVVQMLSQEDQKSAIMSFSSGTLLCETSTLLPIISTVSLSCASYCEVHTLEYCSVWRILQKYPQSGKPLMEKLKERLDMAKLLQEPELLKLKTKDKKMTDIRWFKSQWRNISYQSKGSRKWLEEKHDLVKPYHTSRYLSLYVLSEEVELKTKTICLKSTFPYVFEPTSSFVETFQYLVLISIIMQTLLLPYMLVFEKTFSTETYAIFYTLDGFYILGLILEISTAVKKADRIISTVGQILIYKGKQIPFLVDIAATLPWELLGASSSDPKFSLLRANRLLKIYKVFMIIKQSELNVWVHYIRIRTIKYLTIMVCSVYFLAAFSYGTCNFPEGNLNGWLYYNQGLRFLLTDRTSTLSHFWHSIEYTLTTILSQSWRSYFAYTVTDVLVEWVVVMLGYFIYSFCFSEVGACAVLGHAPVTDYQFYLATLYNFVYKRHVPANIKYFMYSMVQCQWEYNGSFDASGPKSIMWQLPEHLRREILVSRVVRVLRLVPMFFECDEGTLWKVASRMSINVFPPRAILLQQDCFMLKLYVIIRGYCVSESHIPTDKYHEVKTNLTTGDCFPLLEMLMKIDSFLKVTAQTYVELASITYEDLMKALNRESDFYRDLTKVVNTHFIENKIILSRQKGRLPEMVSAEKSQGRGDFFEYEIDDRIVRTKDKMYNINVSKKLGVFRFVRHLLLKRTFNTRKKFYVTWECFRCTVSMVQIAYSLIFIHYTTTPHWHKYVDLMFGFVAVVDFYMRMHCHYYNEQGILVTHPLYTAHHYFSTSFLLDFFCVLPFRWLQIEKFFGSYRSHSILVMTLMTRPFLIHRIFLGVTYLQKRSTGWAVLYHNIKYVMVVLLAVGIAVAILEGVSCQREVHEGWTSCPNDTWIYKDVFREQQTTYMTTLICYYVVMSVYTTSTVGLFSFERKIDVLCMGFLSFMLLAIRWFMLAKITSSRIGGNTTLVHYQHNMKEFIRFTKKSFLRSSLIDETVSHFEYVWKRTKGSPTSTVLPLFHPVLRADFCAFFYEPTMKMSAVLSGLELSEIRHVTLHFNEWTYKKDAQVVRCNDVSSFIYIVHRGTIDVRIANDQLALLTQGGMFGCLDPSGRSRLTITATAKIHVDLLVIDTKTFYSAISRYKTAVTKMQRNRLLNSEYLLPVTVQKEVVLVSEVAMEKVDEGKSSWKKLFMFTIKSDNKWWSLYNYLLNVHVSIFSSLIVMTLIAKVGRYDIMNFYPLGYFFDIVFATKLFLAFHTTYVDQESGVTISNYSKIWKKVMKSPQFWYNTFTILPFEILYWFIRDDNVYRFCWTNRVFRFTYFIRYYNDCKNTLTVSKHLRWTYLMYSMIFLIHTNVCIWWKIACPGGLCKYNPKVSHEPIKLVYTERTAAAFSLAYIYVINVFTSTGLRVVVPTNTYELITSIIIIIFSQLVIVMLTVGFASMLLLDEFEMTNFEKGARRVLKYLNKVNVSFFLKRKVWQYYVMQWTSAHGQWLPQLIEAAPSYLREDIMLDLYAKHLLNHFLFRKTHVDFIRQLIVYLKYTVYMPGMNIVEKGDVDGRMYFIAEGEVGVYDVVNKLEVELMVLCEGTSFGEPQGLYGIAHERTYKALCTTKMLILTKGTWEYLMDWFPASREQIVEQSSRRFKPR